MFLLVFIRWVFYWVDIAVKPLLLTSYVYLLLGAWLLLAGSVTTLFFASIDQSRLQSLYKPILRAFVQNAILAIVVITMLYALFMLSVGQAGESDVFYHQRYVVGNLYRFGQNVYMVFTTPLFLIGVTVLSVRSVSEIAYQLQDNKKWWIYTGLMTIVAAVCYGAYMLLGFL